ncbi:hypothetical protein [Nonomuraea zeae]|uniref:Cyclic nucleotide-binding domain-containing protein n=1 Tax=Nonomuraea zeae TaxID=1642303 RepID=A0A5S4GGA7_9ACTN|nr:hypothetical protein [Nonomuraea zeae]TMR31995.1 hypothetical protein ETD85_24105 [Nonomuraea zeae]
MTIKRQLSIVLILPVATACGLVEQVSNGRPFASAPSKSSSASPFQKRVVTVAEAKKILLSWHRAEREAMRQGGTDWSAAEAGLVAEIHRAEVLLDRIQGEKPEVTQDPIIKPRFFIPRAGAGTPWFMADYTHKGNYKRIQVIFARTPAGWRVTAESVRNGKLPTPARDRDGYAIAVAPDDKSRLTISPRQLAQAHARLVATGGDDRRAKRLIAQNIFTWYAGFRKQEQDRLPSKWDLRRNTRAAPEVYALRTTTGSAMVWYGLTEEDTYAARPGARAMTFKDGMADDLSKGKSFRELAVYKRGSQYLSVIPKSPGQTLIYFGRYGYMSITGA